MKDQMFGTFWQLRWSSDWKTSAPWSLNGVDMPYIGTRVCAITGRVKMRVLGPIALVSVKL